MADFITGGHGFVTGWMVHVTPNYVCSDFYPVLVRAVWEKSRIGKIPG